MKHLLLLVTLILCSISPSLAQWVEPPQFEWARTFGGFGTNWDDNVHLRGMEIDKEENVYVCGFFENFMCFGEDTCVYSATPDSSDIFLVKYDSLGNLLWLRTFGEGGIDEANSLALSSTGSLLVAVNYTKKLTLGNLTIQAIDKTHYPFGPAEGAVVTFNLQGEAQSYFRPDIEIEAGNILSFRPDVIKISNNGTVFIGGRSGASKLTIGNKSITKSPEIDFEFFLAAISPTGEPIYFHRLGSTGLLQAFEVDKMDQLYVKGYFADSIKIGDLVLSEKVGNQDFLIKLSANGKLAWSRIFTSPQINIRYLDTDSKGNLYLTGAVGMPVSFDSVTFHGGYFLLKLDEEMKAIWGYEFEGGWFRGGAMSIIDNAIYVPGSFMSGQIIEDTVIVGYEENNRDNWDILLLRHDPETGSLIWFKQVGWTGDEGAGPIRATEYGNLYFLGGFSSGYTRTDSLDLRTPFPGADHNYLARTRPDLLPPMLKIPKDGWLIYPNPVQDILWIAGEWEDSEASIEMFSMDGRLVMNKWVQTDSDFSRVSIQVPSELATGMYLIRIQQGKQTRSYKIQVSHSFP